MKNFYLKYKPFVIATILILVALFVWYGFGTAYAKVLSCEVHSKTWVTAEYSETTVSADSEGNMSPDTEYWSEPASEVYEAVTLNGELIAIYGEFEPILNGSDYYSPPMPPWWGSMSTDYNFDNFKKHKDSTLHVSTILVIGEEHDRFSTVAYKNKSCIDKLDNYIQVKTWYGVSYSSDF